MASETGHARNVANFENLVSLVQSFGAAYNPPRADLKLSALAPMPTTASDAISETNFHSAAKTAAFRERIDAFEGLDRLVPRVIGALELSTADASIGDAARALARKLRGGRAGEKPADDPATTDVDESAAAHSVSQMSYDSRLANFDALLTLLESPPASTAYAPNEADLKPLALRDFYNDLRAKNTAAVNSEIPLAAARTARNDILYKEQTGLVPIASDVKKYIKSAFGPDSPQYEQVKGLKFTTIRT